MTQQEQQEFQESLEAATSWMQAVEERLRINDNTQGPRAALEARLRETEKIHESEHEGRVKMDIVLVAAEVLLQNGDEEMRNYTHAELKDLKALWEETCTYIIHCHSRIEWVWLHWSEYLKAYEEFELWLARLRRSLDPEVELQLGVKEKLWQVDHQRVLLSDVQSQALLLERLLDEAGALHNRTQDPSVDMQAQERLQESYNHIRDRAEERLALLQKIAEEQQMYQNYVLKFQSWLVSKTEELDTLTEKEDTAENKLKALQTLDDSVASEERTLEHIEGVAEAVCANTSPAGAEVVVEEAEELRLAWQRLRQRLCEAGEDLKTSLDSQNEYVTRCHRLAEDIGRLQALLHRLGRELEEREEGDRTEEQMVGQWRKYMSVRNTLSAEESQVEHLKAQLKELFRFPHDSRQLSDDVLSVVKEHQSVKCRTMKLCSESETGLRQVLQDPLHGYSQWSQLASQVLEASSEVSEFSHIAMLVQNVERLLKHSLQLQERFSLLQVKRDLLDSVFGPERAESLLAELSAAIRNRELLHSQLLQRKSRLQGLISRTKDFGDAYESIRNKLTYLGDRVLIADGLQPDILAKKSQSDQLRVIQKDLDDCEAHIAALETLVSSSSTNRGQFEMLKSDWRLLYKAVRVKLKESEESICEHENFHESLLNVEKWLMIMRQKLESYRSPAGEWSVENRQHEAERALGEFPEKELQLHQTEVQGQGVLERTSEEGRVHIIRDMKHLRDSWMALHDLSLNLFRLLNGHSSSEDHGPELQRENVRGQAGDHAAPDRELLLGESGSQVRGRGSSNQREGHLEGTPGEGHGAWAYESSGTGERMEEGKAGSFGAGEGSEVRVGVRVQGGFEGSIETMDHSGRQDIEHTSSPTILPHGASQKQMNERRNRGSEKERGGGRSLAIEEVDSFIWRGGFGPGGEGETREGKTGTVMTVGFAGGRSPQIGGAEGVSRTTGRTGEWVDDQRSRGAVEPVNMAVHVGYGHSQGSIQDYREGPLEAEERSGGESCLHTGRSFTPTMEVLTLSSQQSPAGMASAQGSARHTLAGPGQALSPADYEDKRKEFEAWLKRENDRLSGILNTKGPLSTKALKIRQNTLKALRSSVGWGQEQFQLLLMGGQWTGAGVAAGSVTGAGVAAGAGAGAGAGARTAVEDVGLEDLRYRWMLYKSKLKDVGDLKARLKVKGTIAGQEENTRTAKQKSPGLLYRVCRVALPLQLLLLSLLLLAFLLPLMEKGPSCSVTNNFRRSFNIMLRYDGPPPT